MNDDSIRLNHKSWIKYKKDQWKKNILNNEEDKYNDFFQSIIDHAVSLDDSIKMEESFGLLHSCYMQLVRTGLTPKLPAFNFLSGIGYEEYTKGKNAIAEIAFKLSFMSGDDNGRNNYGYMLRRGETIKSKDEASLMALKVLRQGIIELKPFEFVNLALTFSLCFGTEQDWRIADLLFKKMPNTSTYSILSWWQEIATKGETEGLLVHFFLMRHNKTIKSELGTVQEIWTKLQLELPSIPIWLKPE